jgi:F-type H+-transporting ATPase subunit delta
MTLSAVGNRYAHALADVVATPKAAARADVTVAELRSFAALLDGSEELRNALTSPAVPPARKRAVVSRLVAALKLGPITRNFLFVLIDHRRIAMVGAIIDAFERIMDERLGFAQAEVTSARAMTEPQRAALNQQLERLTGKKIRMRFSIDDSLIGGAVARIGSTIYDGSVRGQLATLGRRLKAGA